METDKQEEDDGEQPSPSVIRAIKEKLPGRDLHRVEKWIDDDTTIVFIMTGPTKPEWKKYQGDASLAAGEEEKVEKALLHGVLAQVRWPARAEVEAIFEKYPALIATFPRDLNTLAGLEAKTTIKKL